MGDRLESTAARACMTTPLMLFNVAFWISGVLLLLFGIRMRIQFRDDMDMSLESTGGILLALACLGALIVLVSTLAYCCIAQGHPALLYLYGAFLAVVALIEIGAGASVYANRNALDERFFSQGTNDSMPAYYANPEMTNYIDTTQTFIGCCGHRSYTDWLEVKPPKEIPKSCCILPDCNVKNPAEIYTEGCYNRVIDFLHTNFTVVAVSVIAIAFFPLVGVFLACCLASSINKSKYEHVG